jgi:hypothetical protein
MVVGCMLDGCILDRINSGGDYAPGGEGGGGGRSKQGDETQHTRRRK